MIDSLVSYVSFWIIFYCYSCEDHFTFRSYIILVRSDSMAEIDLHLKEENRSINHCDFILYSGSGLS